jgi:hypothetical protein
VKIIYEGNWSADEKKQAEDIVNEFVSNHPEFRDKIFTLIIDDSKNVLEKSKAEGYTGAFALNLGLGTDNPKVLLAHGYIEYLKWELMEYVYKGDSFWAMPTAFDKRFEGMIYYYPNFTFNYVELNVTTKEGIKIKIRVDKDPAYIKQIIELLNNRGMKINNPEVIKNYLPLEPAKEKEEYCPLWGSSAKEYNQRLKEQQKLEEEIKQKEAELQKQQIEKRYKELASMPYEYKSAGIQFTPSQYQYVSKEELEKAQQKQSVQTVSAQGLTSSLSSTVKKYWWIVLIPILVILLVIIFISMRR